jgi:hypothetical protein
MLVGYEHVHGDAAGWPGDKRINVKTADEVAGVGRQRRQAHHGVRH